MTLKIALTTSTEEAWRMPMMNNYMELTVFTYLEHMFSTQPTLAMLIFMSRDNLICILGKA